VRWCGRTHVDPVSQRFGCFQASKGLSATNGRVLLTTLTHSHFWKQIMKKEEGKYRLHKHSVAQNRSPLVDRWKQTICVLKKNHLFFVCKQSTIQLESNLSWHKNVRVGLLKWFGQRQPKHLTQINDRPNSQLSSEQIL
jgi:ABC-type Fe3+-citrate transport system substrate-binding protein